jgi:TolB-like protein
MERRLAAILAADVVGYTRLMGEDEMGTLQRLTALREGILEPLIANHRGRVVKLMGDGLLLEFASVVDAVTCALSWQEAVTKHESDGASEVQLRFRIGINLGDIIVEGGDIHGDGVNIAARLEGLADPGGICLSGDVFRHIKGKIEAEFEDMGEQDLKNIAEPVRVYRIVAERSVAISPTSTRGTLSLPDKPSIAILPFTNLSDDPEQAYFSDGISEDIITALSKVSKLFVVARNSTFTYRGRAVDVKQVGREQGVKYVLEGSVRRAGDRLRITAQLIDAVTGHHIWAQRYDRVVQDVFELQDEITREVTSALQVELTEGEQAQLWASGTRNLAAWELVIQIQDLLHTHRREETLKARRLAKQALGLDDGYAAAWAFLGESHWQEVFGGWSEDPEHSLGLALDAMNRSRNIDDGDPDTFGHLAFLHLSLHKYEEAHAFAQQSLALGPSNSHSAAVAANVALYCNQPDDMVVLLKKAMRLCPIYPAWYVGDLAWAHLLMGRQEEAVTIAQEAIGIDPDYIYTYCVLAIAHAELGRTEEAAAAVENILRIDSKCSLRIFAGSQPFRDSELLDRHLDGLRKAGLPE